MEDGPPSFYRGTPAASRAAQQAMHSPAPFSSRAPSLMDRVIEQMHRSHAAAPPAAKRPKKAASKPPQPELFPQGSFRSRGHSQHGAGVVASARSPQEDAAAGMPPPAATPGPSAAPVSAARPESPPQAQAPPPAASPPPPPAAAADAPDVNSNTFTLHEWIVAALANHGLCVGEAGTGTFAGRLGQQQLKGLAGVRCVGRAKVDPVATPMPEGKLPVARTELDAEEWQRTIAFAEEFGLRMREGAWRIHAACEHTPARLHHRRSRNAIVHDVVLCVTSVVLARAKCERSRTLTCVLQTACSENARFIIP